MSSPWKINHVDVEVPVNLNEIMNEEYAKQLQAEEIAKCKDDPGGADKVEPLSPIEVPAPIEEPIIRVPAEVLEALKGEPDYQKIAELDSDAKIAQMLQEQFNKEYDHYLKRYEKVNNKNSKVQISFSKYRTMPDGIVDDSDDEPPEPIEERKDWDRFETNEKQYSKVSKKKGYSVNEEGEMKTKHDADLVGRRNACKVMSFPPEFETGDAGAFDMRLDNKVFNQLKQSVKQNKKHSKAFDRKEAVETVVMGLDEPTRLILYKMINNQVLESVDGVVSTGKEAVILHAETDQTDSEKSLPKEVAIKIFSTTLNEFKQRDRYIKDDYRFKGRFSKQNSHTIINMWAEKEMHNLQRIKKAGIPCPDVVLLKKHVLVMRFIGDNSRAAPKLKEVKLNDADWSIAYEEVVQYMHRLYKDARLVHADLSEYNILYYQNTCWLIDVAQSVEPTHPGALEFLMRDCDNIVSFFSKKGIPNIPSKEELFFTITGLDPLTFNVNQLERIHMKGAPAHIITCASEGDEIPERFKPLEYPFDLAWEKVEEMKRREGSTVEITDSLQELRYQEI